MTAWHRIRTGNWELRRDDDLILARAKSRPTGWYVSVSGGATTGPHESMDAAMLAAGV